MHNDDLINFVFQYLCFNINYTLINTLDNQDQLKLNLFLTNYMTDLQFD